MLQKLLAVMAATGFFFTVAPTPAHAAKAGPLAEDSYAAAVKNGKKAKKPKAKKEEYLRAAPSR